MKKMMFLPFLLFLAIGAVHAQDSKLPKLRLNSGFLSQKWELGDKDVTEKEVSLHLEKNNTQAYYLFRRGKSAENWSVAWMGVTVVGAILAVSTKDLTTAVTGAGIAVVGGTGAIVCVINSGSRRDRAMQKYNKDAGY